MSLTACTSAPPSQPAGPVLRDQARWVPVAVQIPQKSANEAGPGAHRIEFEITQRAADEDKEWKVNERSTFVVPR